VTCVASVAVTVKVEEPPAAIEVGLAAILTVGIPATATITITVADVFPPTPDAVAVYSVVAVGLTDCVPPFGCKVYELPSDPAIVTCVAFVAVTVNMEELPGITDAGLALMPTIGAVGGLTPLAKIPQPVNTINRKKQKVEAIEQRASKRNRPAHCSMPSIAPSG
jgi:hypothetical protein